jgi:class 3 adenylate cyclase/tetratricopeptide (TPR) repeat protein
MTMNEVDFTTIFDEIDTLQQSGELFAAIDLIKQTLSKIDQPPLALRQNLVQVLARAGCVQEALHWYQKLALHKEDDIDSRSLVGRLYKDLAYSGSAAQQKQALQQARNVYLEIYRDTEDGYPGINAATLSALIAEPEQAREIASGVLQELQAVDDAAKGYWHYATLAEAHILQGNLKAAANAIQQAAEYRSHSLSDRASTLQQLSRLLRSLGLADDILQPLRPKPVLHFTGHMVAPAGADGRILAENEPVLQKRIEQAVQNIDPGVAFGSLASGADILIVETLLEQGVEVNIVLPFALDDFIACSVAPAGGNWQERFTRCLEQSSGTVRYLTDQAYMGDDILFGLCSKLAMGRALLRAKHLEGEAVQLAVWDGEVTDFPAGTAFDMGLWQDHGDRQEVVDVSDLGRKLIPKKAAQSKAVAAKKTNIGNRVDVAMLFGDFKGFSKLTDTELPDFAGKTLAKAASALVTGPAECQFINTWGDGLFAVWSDPVQAAECALRLQESLVGEAGQKPADLPIRISLHYGVAHELFDPVLQKQNYFGEAVSRAARIEPITPVGEVYVTEAFAAMLNLDPNSNIGTEYVGKLATAKNYGQIELYRMVRSRA